MFLTARVRFDDSRGTGFVRWKGREMNGVGIVGWQRSTIAQWIEGEGVQGPSRKYGFTPQRINVPVACRGALA